MKNYFLCLILAISLVSCYNKSSEPEFNMDMILPADSMISLLTDLHMTDGIINTLKSKKQPAGHLANEYYEIILQKHAITREIFEESMRYYAYHAEQLDDIYEQVITDLSKQESILKADTIAQKPAE